MLKRNIVKTRNNPLLYIPVAYSFSQFEEADSEQNALFNLSDDGREEKKVFDKIAADTLFLNILFNLTEIEKIIYLYQLAREFGYEIDHSSLSKTLGIHRVVYMRILKRVKEKVKEMLDSQELQQASKK